MYEEQYGCDVAAINPSLVAWPRKKEIASAKKPKMDNASGRVAPDTNPKSEAIEIEGEETDKKEKEEQKGSGERWTQSKSQ